LEDRTRIAGDLGLPREEVESIFRLLLRASRDHQSALRVEVPPDAEPKTIAIIGGRGQMGTLLTRLFADLGHRVLCVDRDTELTAPAAAAAADVTIVSVPMDVTEQVIHEV